MANNVLRDLNFGFLGFFTAMLVCVAIRPEGLIANDGFSYYGVFASTIVPYVLAFAAIGFSLTKAALELDGAGSNRVLVWIFRIDALLLFGLIITPHNVPILDNIHVALGSTLFASEFLVAIWLTILKPRVARLLLLLITFIAGLASFYYLPLRQGYLLEAQALFQIGFWQLLVRAVQDQEKAVVPESV